MAEGQEANCNVFMDLGGILGMGKVARRDA